MKELLLFDVFQVTAVFYLFDVNCYTISAAKDDFYPLIMVNLDALDHLADDGFVIFVLTFGSLIQCYLDFIETFLNGFIVNDAFAKDAYSVL